MSTQKQYVLKDEKTGYYVAETWLPDIDFWNPENKQRYFVGTARAALHFRGRNAKYRVAEILQRIMKCPNPAPHTNKPAFKIVRTGSAEFLRDVRHQGYGVLR